MHIPTDFAGRTNSANPRAIAAAQMARNHAACFLDFNPSRRATTRIQVRYSGRRYVAQAFFTDPQGRTVIATAFA